MVRIDYCFQQQTGHRCTQDFMVDMALFSSRKNRKFTSASRAQKRITLDILCAGDAKRQAFRPSSHCFRIIESLSRSEMRYLCGRN